MSMLTQEDLTQIGEEFGKVIEHNLLPALDTMIDEKLKPVKADLDSVKRTVATLPDKHFVTEKIGDLEVKMVAGFRRLESRTDDLVGVLKEKNVINQADVTRLDAARLYPRPTA